MEEITDQEIAARVLAGEVNYFRLIVERYQQSIIKFIYYNIPNPNVVEDIAQETFFRAYKYLHSYNPDQTMKNWLFAIAVNQCRRQYLISSYFSPITSCE